VSEGSAEMAAGIMVENEVASTGMDSMGDTGTVNAPITSAPVSNQLVPDEAAESDEGARPARAKRASKAKAEE
jgi:hypothetical protein